MNNIKIMSNSSNLFKVAIVDDNNSEIDELKKLIEKFELENSCNIEVSVFNDGNQFLGSSMQSFDIVYMDMLMPGLDGIEVSKMLRNISKNVQIIIVSSTPNFAIKGYLVDAVGYILKPVNYFIFKTTTEKAIENLKKEASAFIYINNKGEKLKVNLNDVLYVEVLDHDLFVILKDTRYKIRLTLNEFYENYKKFGFAKPNKSYLVNLKYIDSIKGNEINILGHIISISKLRRKEFEKEFYDYLGEI